MTLDVKCVPINFPREFVVVKRIKLPARSVMKGQSRYLPVFYIKKQPAETMAPEVAAAVHVQAARAVKYW